MDKLVATRGFPGLSYLNTSERAMAILNIGLPGLSLSIDSNTENWLLSKFLKGLVYMKAVRNNLYQLYRTTNSLFCSCLV